ncbi:MAG: DNA repair protein RecO [Bacteroidales bacterium]
MLEKTRGIMLGSVRYSDNSSIAKIYTEQFGKIALLVRHPKTKKTISRKGILQPLFLLEMNLQYKQIREIQQAREININPVLHDIPFNVVKSTISFFLAELLLKVIKEEESNRNLFEFLYNSIQWLDNCHEGYAGFHLVFMLELSKYLGFYPNDNYSEINKFFNIREGMFEEKYQLNEISLNEEISKTFFSLRKCGFSGLEQFKINRSLKNEILNSLLQFYKYHLPEMGPIKSLTVLNQIFNP